MPVTSCNAQMKFIDVSARGNSTVAPSGGQSFDKTSLFKEEEETAIDKRLVLGHNSMIMDGTASEFPDVPTDVAYMSTERSGADCKFATNPKIVITFDGNHSSAGLTFYFADHYPGLMTVTWFNSKGSKLVADNFKPNTLTFFASKQVSNFTKIEIEFIETVWPEQYIQLQYILYGKNLFFSGDTVQTASITEELDVTGSEISINNGSIDILDEDDEFNIGNNAGDWQYVQKMQQVHLKEYQDDTEIEMGTFFIEDFSFKDNVVTFNLIDSVGILDLYTFYSGDIYTNVKAGTVIKAIFDTVGSLKYEVEEDIANTLLTGYLGVVTCREALQMVAFITGAIVDDSRSDTIRIKKASKKITNIINVDRKFNGNTSIAQEDYYSGVSIECSRYTESANSTDIYDDTLPAGDNKITFATPYRASTITCSGGTLKEVHTNYCIVTMASEGACKVSGYGYDESKFIVSRNHALDGGQVANVKAYTGVTLYSASTIQDKLEELLKYWDLQKTMKMKYLISAEKTGEWATIKDINGFSNSTLIESQTIDLTGGFISTASCRGYTLINTNGLYAGNGELYADGDKGGAIA